MQIRREYMTQVEKAAWTKLLAEKIQLAAKTVPVVQILLSFLWVKFSRLQNTSELLDQFWEHMPNTSAAGPGDSKHFMEIQHRKAPTHFTACLSTF